MAIFTCSAKFPNICANAKSAINVRGYSNTKTRVIGGSYYTSSFWNNKKTHKPSLAARRRECRQSHPWIGSTRLQRGRISFCFGNTGNNAAVRLVPQQENTDHSQDLDMFYQNWNMAAGSTSLIGQARINDGRKNNRGRPFMIEFEAGVADESTQWGLTNNAAGNICAKPYGSDFLLVGGPPNSVNSDQWDPYFQRQNRLKTYVLEFNSGAVTSIYTYPPQYCQAPSPGRMTLVNGAFQSVRPEGVQIGMAKAAANPNDIGACEPWPRPAGTRKIKARDANVTEHGDASVEVTALPQEPDVPLQPSKHPRHAPALSVRDPGVHIGGHLVGSNISTEGGGLQTSKRSTWPGTSNRLKVSQGPGGSYRDPNICAYMDCSNDDYDPCEWGAVCNSDDSDDGNGSDPGTTGGSPTTTPAITSKPSITTKAPASTTYSSSSNCKNCIGVVGTPTSCSYVNGCTPTAPTSSPPSPPPPPPPSTPPTPKQTSSNNKGSGLCASLGDESAKDNSGQNMCQIAYHRHLDDYLYTQYTSYTYTADDAFNTALDFIFRGLKGLVGQEGCTAYFKCDNDDDYKKGMTGAQIKSACDNLFANNKVKVCGSSYLDNGCRVTVNGCNNCVDVGAVCSTKAGDCSPDEAANSPSDNDST